VDTRTGPDGCGKFRPAGTQSRDRPACIKLLYRFILLLPWRWALVRSRSSYTNYVAVTRRTNGRRLEIFKKLMFFFLSEIGKHWIEKYFQFFIFNWWLHSSEAWSSIAYCEGLSSMPVFLYVFYVELVVIEETLRQAFIRILLHTSVSTTFSVSHNYLHHNTAYMTKTSGRRVGTFTRDVPFLVLVPIKQKYFRL
jgi:hypothetical protein